MTKPRVGAREGDWPEVASQRPLGVLWRAVRTHPVVVGLVAAATVLGALVWLEAKAPEYRATAQVLVSPRPPDDQSFVGLSVIKDTGDPTRTIQTAAGLLESPEAAGVAARRLGPGWSGPAVLGAIDIVPRGESNILDVMATAATPAEAAAVANAFVAAVLRQRDRVLRRQAGPIIARLETARAGLSAVDRDTATELGRRVTQLREVRSDGDPTIELARRATLPEAPEGASSRLVLVLALGAGAVLAAVVALVIQLLEPARVATELQLAELTPLPVLARVPRLRRWSVRRPRSPPPLPRAAIKAFNTLWLQLEVMLESEPRVVMLTSPSRGDGKTTSVVQFGQTLAAAGRKALLVDLEPDWPQLAQALGITPERDPLAFANNDNANRGPLVNLPGHPGLVLMVAALSAPHANGDLLIGPLQQLLDDALDEFAYVLLDTPPLAEVSDALKLASVADAVLVVVRLGDTRAGDLEIAGDLLERTGRHDAGIIVVG